jgi:multidrug/hemolysin transport system ATP-binding protein
MEPIIQVVNLKKYYKEVKAVDDISFKVNKGQLYGFLGVNGAGKSTTINILCTLLKETEGEATICGYSLGRDSKEIRSKIGVVFQDNTLDDRLTVKENLVIRGSLYHSDTNIIKKNLSHVCEILNIGDLLKRQFYKLSGGQKRRCEIAKALMNTPEILFLDEPTTGLDPGTRQQVWECIEGLQREDNMTVFLTTHYMEEASKAQYISIMDRGKIVATGTPHELKNKYASDMVKMFPKDKSILARLLTDANYEFKSNSNAITLMVPDTLKGLEILNQFSEQIAAFEVVQGTMDDVFLNITGKSL